MTDRLKFIQEQLDKSTAELAAQRLILEITIDSQDRLYQMGKVSSCLDVCIDLTKEQIQLLKES